MALLTNINGKFSVSDAGAVTFNNAFTFPTADGTANYVLQTNGSGQLAWALNGNGDISGSGTANTVTKFTDAKTIGNGPITFSGNNSTFAGDITTSGDIELNGANKYIYLRTGTNSGLWQEDNFSLRFGTNNIEALELDNSQNATFAGNITVGTNANIDNNLTVSGGNITLGGTGRIQGVDTVSAGTDAANKAYVDTTAGAYLPLAGGTMTGDLKLNDNVDLYLGTGNDFQAYHDGSNTYLRNLNGSFIIKQDKVDADLVFQSDDGAGGTATYMYLDGSIVETRFAKDTRHNDNIKAKFGDAQDLQIYHDGSNSYIQDTSGTGDLRVDTNVFRLRSANGGESMITAFEDGAVNLMNNDITRLSTTSTGVTVTGTVSATTFSGDLNGTINTVTTATTKGNSTNDTTVATTAFVQNVIGTIPAGLVFQGTWNASTNSPTLTSGSGTTGNFYIVSVAGSTNLDGITDWQVGDWAVFIEQGASDQWEKIDNSSVLSGSGTGGSFAGWSGSGTSVTLGNAPVTFSGNNSTFAGGITVSSPGSSFYTTFKSANDYVIALKDSANTTQWWLKAYTNGAFALHEDNVGDKFTIAAGGNATFAGIVGVGGTPTSGYNIDSVQDTAGYSIVGRHSSGGKVGIYSSTGDNGIGTINNYPMNFFTNNSGPQVTLTTAGNVGIGTTSPSKKLEVVGNAEVVGTLYVEAANNNIRLLDTNDSTVNFSVGVNGKFQVRDVDAATNIFQIEKGAASNSLYIDEDGNVGIGTTAPTYKLSVSGGIEAGGLVTYSKVAGSLNTTGYAVAGLTTGFNGASAGFEFKCYGSTGKYQRIVYSCYGDGTTWRPRKVIDEGTNDLDVSASADGTTITFTFKARSSTQSYSPRVVVQATGHSINSTYA